MHEIKVLPLNYPDFSKNKHKNNSSILYIVYCILYTGPRWFINTIKNTIFISRCTIKRIYSTLNYLYKHRSATVNPAIQSRYPTIGFFTKGLSIDIIFVILNTTLLYIETLIFSKPSGVIWYFLYYLFFLLYLVLLNLLPYIFCSITMKWRPIIKL